MKYISKLFIDDSAVTSVEYAVMLALIVGVCIVTITVVGDLATLFRDDASDGVSKFVR